MLEPDFYVAAELSNAVQPQPEPEDSTPINLVISYSQLPLTEILRQHVLKYDMKLSRFLHDTVLNSKLQALADESEDGIINLKDLVSDVPDPETMVSDLEDASATAPTLPTSEAPAAGPAAAEDELIPAPVGKNRRRNARRRAAASRRIRGDNDNNGAEASNAGVVNMPADPAEKQPAEIGEHVDVIEPTHAEEPTFDEESTPVDEITLMEDPAQVDERSQVNQIAQVEEPAQFNAATQFNETAEIGESSQVDEIVELEEQTAADELPKIEEAPAPINDPITVDSPAPINERYSVDETALVDDTTPVNESAPVHEATILDEHSSVEETDPVDEHDESNYEDFNSLYDVSDDEKGGEWHVVKSKSSKQAGKLREVQGSESASGEGANNQGSSGSPSGTSGLSTQVPLTHILTISLSIHS